MEEIMKKNSLTELEQYAKETALRIVQQKINEVGKQLVSIENSLESLRSTQGHIRDRVETLQSEVSRLETTLAQKQQLIENVVESQQRRYGNFTDSAFLMELYRIEKTQLVQATLAAIEEDLSREITEKKQELKDITESNASTLKKFKELENGLTCLKENLIVQRQLQQEITSTTRIEKGKSSGSVCAA